MDLKKQIEEDLIKHIEKLNIRVEDAKLELSELDSVKLNFGDKETKINLGKLKFSFTAPFSYNQGYFDSEYYDHVVQLKKDIAEGKYDER